jgi:hypothetical protein
VLLDVGDNRHSPVLEELLHQETNGAAILLAIRQLAPSCINVVNKNMLVEEEQQAIAAVGARR